MSFILGPHQAWLSLRIVRSASLFLKVFSKVRVRRQPNSSVVSRLIWLQAAAHLGGFRCDARVEAVGLFSLQADLLELALGDAAFHAGEGRNG